MKATEAASRHSGHPSGLQIALAILVVALGALATTTIAGANPTGWLLSLGLIASLPFLVLCRASPLLAWVVALSLVLLPEVQSGVAGPGIGLADFAFIALAGSAALRRLTAQTPASQKAWPDALFALAGIYVVLAGLSALWASDSLLALKDSTKWLEIIAIVWATKQVVGNLPSVRLAILGYWGVFAAGAGLSVLSRLIIWANGDFPYLRGGGEAGSLAAIVAIAILWTHPSKALRRLARLVTVVGIFSIAVSLTRQSIVTLLVAALAMLLLSSRISPTKRQVFFNLLFAGIAIALVLAILPTDVRTFLDIRIASFDLRQETASNLARSSLLSAAVDIWRNNPILGVGAGNFPVAVSNYPLFGVSSSALATIGPHDWFLNFAAETGSVGLLIFASLVMSVTYAVWKLALNPVSVGGAGFIKVALVGIWAHWLTTLFVADITGSTRLSLAATIGLMLAARHVLRSHAEQRFVADLTEGLPPYSSRASG